MLTEPAPAAVMIMYLAFGTEPVLREHAEALAVTCASAPLESFSADADGVAAVVTHRDSGVRQAIRPAPRSPRTVRTARCGTGSASAAG